MIRSHVIDNLPLIPTLPWHRIWSLPHNDHLQSVPVPQTWLPYLHHLEQFDIQGPALFSLAIILEHLHEQPFIQYVDLFDHRLQLLPEACRQPYARVHMAIATRAIKDNELLQTWAYFQCMSILSNQFIAKHYEFHLVHVPRLISSDVCKSFFPRCVICSRSTTSTSGEGTQQFHLRCAMCTQ